jgi:paraquat-inducible protein B
MSARSVSEDGEQLTPELQKDKVALKEELMATAKQLRNIPSMNLVVLDTENKFISTGSAKELAEAAGGKVKVIKSQYTGTLQSKNTRTLTSENFAKKKKHATKSTRTLTLVNLAVPLHPQGRRRVHSQCRQGRHRRLWPLNLST